MVTTHLYTNSHIIVTLLFAAYKCPNWLVTPYCCKTDTCSNSACRSPGLSSFFFTQLAIVSTGTMSAIFIMESVLDHVARSLDLDVEQVKDTNLYKQGDTCYVVSYMHTISQRMICVSQMNYPKPFTLDHCNIRDMWTRECVVLYPSFFTTFVTELYSTADVTNRKQQVADYNKVCYYR